MSKKCNVVCEDYVSLLLDSYQIMHDQNEVIFFLRCTKD